MWLSVWYSQSSVTVWRKEATWCLSHISYQEEKGVNRNLTYELFVTLFSFFRVHQISLLPPTLCKLCLKIQNKHRAQFVNRKQNPCFSLFLPKHSPSKARICMGSPGINSGGKLGNAKFSRWFAKHIGKHGHVFPLSSPPELDQTISK